MNSKSIAEEIDQELKGKRHPIRKAIIIAASTLVFGGGMLAFASSHSHSDTSNSAPSFATTSDSTAPAPAPAPTPQPAVVPQVVVVNQTPPPPSQQVLDAQLCKSMIDNANGFSKSYIQMYMDGWNSWIQTYRGDYSSQAALDSKEWDKNYIQKLFSDYISTNDPNVKKTCHSATSLADIMLQPNYDAW